mmetsp:Transcript_122396/g.346009  ORF Transcript_122396/g.346009 Transcript_122396/m.346009 type:complete len:296 (-) Transcript_122396:1326-2213(-)
MFPCRCRGGAGGAVISDGALVQSPLLLVLVRAGLFAALRVLEDAIAPETLHPIATPLFFEAVDQCGAVVARDVHAQARVATGTTPHDVRDADTDFAFPGRALGLALQQPSAFAFALQRRAIVAAVFCFPLLGSRARASAAPPAVAPATAWAAMSTPGTTAATASWLGATATAAAAGTRSFLAASSRAAAPLPTSAPLLTLREKTLLRALRRDPPRLTLRTPWFLAFRRALRNASMRRGAPPGTLRGALRHALLRWELHGTLRRTLRNATLFRRALRNAPFLRGALRSAPSLAGSF